jgi:hypothetical protein
LLLLEQEISDQQCEGIAEAPGEGTFRCAYPYHAGWVYVNSLSMKSFHGVWAGNIHKCLPKTSIGKVSYIERFNGTLRQRVSRLVRETLSFSKKLTHHIGAIKFFICHYSLTRAAALPV